MDSMTNYPCCLQLRGKAGYPAGLVRIIIDRLIIPVRLRFLEISRIIFSLVALSPGWVMGGPISYDDRKVYRIDVSNAIGPPLTLPGMRPIHIMPQLGDIEYNA